MRGETDGECDFSEEDEISIHSPHAGRDGNDIHNLQTEVISIHSPHAGRDYIYAVCL